VVQQKVTKQTKIKTKPSLSLFPLLDLISLNYQLSTINFLI